MTHTRIRPATQEDAAAIAQIFATCMQVDYQSMLDAQYIAERTAPEAVAQSATRYASWMRAESQCFSVAENTQGEVVGFAWAGFPAREVDVETFQAYVELHQVYVLPDYRQQGLAKALIRDVLSNFYALAAESAEEAGVSLEKLFLWVFKANEPSRGIYERLGATLIPDSEFQYGEQHTSLVAYGWDSMSALLNRLQPPGLSLGDDKK